MLQCQTCNSSKPCPACDDAYHDILPCNLPSAVWVRVAQRGGPKLEGVKVMLGELKSGLTGANGFAVFDPVEAPQDWRVGLDLATRGFDKKYKRVDPKTQNVVKGQTVLVPFELDPLAKAVVRPNQLVLFVKGKARNLELGTDEAYDGPGTFTGVDADFLEAVQGAQRAGANVALKAKDRATTWDGLPLSWKLDEVPVPPAAAKVCIVKAALQAFWPLDLVPVAAEKKLDPGVVVALKTEANAKPARAKLRLVVEPKEFDGKLQLKAKNGKVKLFDQAQDGAEVAEVEGPFAEERAVFVEGAALSGAKLDEEVQLLAGDDLLDKVAVTVVQVSLTIHQDVVRKPEGEDDVYTAIPEKKRVIRPDPKHKLLRTKLLLEKKPWDAPCAVKLSGEGVDGVTVYRQQAKLLGKLRWLELSVTGETALALPSTHKLNPAFAEPTEDFVKAEPVWLWLEGKAAGEMKLWAGIDQVQEKIDAVALTVEKPQLRIEVTRAFPDPAPLPAEIRVGLFVMGTDVDLGFPKLGAGDAFKEAAVDAANYRIVLEPTGAEAGARLVRTEPASDDAAVAVGVNTVVKYELRPKYAKVQFIAYGMYTGQSKGIDLQKDAHDERVTEARKDMKAKAALMRGAIAELTAKKVNRDRLGGPDTLKIFMAPEFTFRGAQGAYPIEVVSEIFAELAPEIDNDKYDDWLFVAGTGVGTVTSPRPVIDPARIVSAQQRSVFPWDTDHPDDGKGADDVKVMPNARRYAHFITYQDWRRPAPGWAMISPVTGSVVRSGHRPPPDDDDWTAVDHRNDVIPANAPVAVQFVNPPEVEIANVALIRKGGKKVPAGAGGRGMRQALINKEYVAWGDLPSTVDLNHEYFFHAGRQLVTLYGMVCRAKPPADSAMEGTFNNWSWAPSPPPKTEQSASGMGGGTAFQMDGIRFGLEICMDHNWARLKNSNPPIAKVHVQLVPSGGAQINPGSLWTVPGGLIFNADMKHCAAMKGTNDIAVRGNPIAVPGDASAHYDVADDAPNGKPWGNGKVFIFIPADIAW